MTVRRLPVRWATGLGLLLLLAPSVQAQTGATDSTATPAGSPGVAGERDPAAAFAQLRAAFTPARDDLGVLAGMASAAARLGDLSLFRAALDSVVGGGAAGPNALSYWGAVSLQQGSAAGPILAAFDAYLNERPRDRAALVSFFRVLAANGAYDEASRLLDAEIGRGVRSVAVAIMRGEIAEARDDPKAALDAYLEALADGEEPPGTVSAEAAARIETLLDAWPSDPPIESAIERLERARPAAQEEVLVPLLVHARIAAGDWESAAAVALASGLDAEARGGELRKVAQAARDAADLAAASQVLELLLDLGPPAAHDEDRMLAADVAAGRGDSGAAAEALRQAAAKGVAGAAARVLEAEVAQARETGDPGRLADALERGRRSGADPAVIAVPQGDLWLARGRPDSAIVAYARGAPVDRSHTAALEALARVRLVQSLLRARAAHSLLVEVGQALVGAPARPAGAAATFERLARAVGEADSLEIARSLLLGLAGESWGRAGDAAGASAKLERAASRPAAGGEAPALLLAAGRWAREAGQEDRAAALWRELVQRHPGSPYALEARRLLVLGEPSPTPAP